MKRLWLCLTLLLMAAPARAQFPAAPAAGTAVEVDPIRCWWLTSAGAVRLGEIFDLSLTCAVIETDTVRVVPDESRLALAAMSLAPFEIVGGNHPADLRSGARRFFQYQYQVRIISKDAIGSDTALPPLSIHYTISNRMAGQGTVEGRDLVYILPSEPVRVASMVPSDAKDIRDATGADFRHIEALLFRARVLDIVATASLALGGIVAALMLVALARKTRARVPAGERLLSTGRLVRTAADELNRVARERQERGWDETLAARALAATRVVAAAAVGGRISQRPTAADGRTDGTLVASGGFRGQRRTISAAATSFDVERALQSADAAGVPLLESLRDALTTFGASQYGREVRLDERALDSSLSSARSAAGRVRSEHSWLTTWLRRLRSAAPVRVASRA